METDGSILVVDDNKVCRIVVSKMLSHLRYEVSSADSGENGFRLFLKKKFDIVLSDYEMSGMDGVALACSVKKSSPPHAGRYHDGCWKGDRFFQEHHCGGRGDIKAIYLGKDR